MVYPRRTSNELLRSGRPSSMQTLVESSNFVPLLIFGGSFLVAIVAIIAGVGQKVLIGRNRERPRQEVAAYVAEGTMTADEGERLLRAGK